MEYWHHSMGPGERALLRERAVQAVSAGEKKRHVALRLGITRQTLHNWVEKYRRGGTAALVAKPRGRVRGGTSDWSPPAPGETSIRP
jgi:transposase